MELDIQFDAIENHVPIIMEESLWFILSYIVDNKVKDILEVGTAVAYSSISMANMRSKIRVDTLERDEDLYNKAVANIRGAGLDKQIKPIFIDAIDFETDKMYEMIFIDGAKSQYSNHMAHFEGNLKTGGAFIFDNLNFYGLVDAAYPAKTRNVRGIVRKIKKFREEMLTNLAYDVNFYPEIGDGVLIAVKK